MITERRTSRRFAGRIGIVSADEEGLNFSFIADLSRDGAYVESEKIAPVGSVFSFMLSNDVTRAQVSGRVMRTRDAFFHGGKSGFGIRFSPMDHPAKVLRDDLLLFLMSERHHSKWEAA